MKAYSPSPAASAGVTLVELLVAMLLGMFLVAGMLQVFASFKQTYRVSDQLSELDEAGRFAMNFLAEDIRAAGYLSCGGSDARIASVVNGGTSWMYQTSALDGFEGGVSTFPADFGDVLNGTDAIVVHHAVPGNSSRITSHSYDDAEFTLTAAPQFAVGDIVVAADAGCSQATLIQITSELATNSVGYDGGNEPGNCTHAVLGNFNCDDTSPALPATLKAGTTLMPFAAHAYYVTASDPPALVRRRLAYNPAEGNAVTEMLVDNVDGFQILYGVNSLKDGQRVADEYVPANEVSDWRDVVSVRLALLLRSQEDNVRTEADTRTYDLIDTTVDPADDRRLRKTFSTVITLRNQAP